ncbi:MAG: hypothetical protein AAB439_02235 [Patescibacteria group bacterium]
MITKKEIERLLEYKLLGLKALGAFAVVILKSPVLFLLYFVVDISHGFYQKYQEDKNQDLSDAKIDSVAETATQTKEDLDKLAKEQKEYFADRAERQKALGLLNKLLAESEVREKDLFALATTSGYYTLFVYSASLGRLVRSLAIPDFETQPNRLYPVFLKDLGFARLGKRSACFLINKNNLKEEKLKDIKEFKKFLMYHLDKIRDKEWAEFLTKLEQADKAQYERLKDINYRDQGYLMINFLLTQTNMNVTNIGFVSGDRLGLGEVASNEDINRQIFSGTNVSEEVNEEELKVRIKKVISKQDVSFLLHGVSQASKLLIASEQDSIKENLSVRAVLGFANVNQVDLSNELIRVGVGNDEAESTATAIITRAQEYQAALTNLQIDLES